MAKLTVIFGPQASGKSQTAKALVSRKKTLFIEGHQLKTPFWTAPLYDQNVECIVIDELNLKDLELVVGLCRSSKLEIQKQTLPNKAIDTPKFYAVISNEPLPEQVLAVAGGRGFELIECKRKEVSNG